MPSKCVLPGCEKRADRPGDYCKNCKPDGHKNQRQRLLEEDKKNGTAFSKSKQQSKLLAEDNKNGTAFSQSKKQSKLLEEDNKNGTAFSSNAAKRLKVAEAAAPLSVSQTKALETLFQLGLKCLADRKKIYVGLNGTTAENEKESSAGQGAGTADGPWTRIDFR